MKPFLIMLGNEYSERKEVVIDAKTKDEAERLALRFYAPLWHILYSYDATP